MGGMTLAVMTRATLGHTGQPLTADRWTAAIYLLVATAAALRVAASFSAEVYLLLLWTSGLAWSLAFALFAAHYGRMLLSREPVVTAARGSSRTARKLREPFATFPSEDHDNAAAKSPSGFVSGSNRRSEVLQLRADGAGASG
jgi:hypothetical protein